MSKYTTEVKFICENAVGLTVSAGYNSVNKIIQGAIPKVFDFDFPIYDESYRNVLCGKILKHYYTREIGLETVGLWKLHLDMRLNEIMPYYNQLYRSAMIDFNPLYDVDLTTTMDKDTGGKTEVNGQDKTLNNFTDTKSFNDSKTAKYGKTVTTNNTGNTQSIKEDESQNTTVYGKTVTTNTSGSGSDEVDSNGDYTRRDLFSDTPQGALDNIENETYLTNARKNTNAETGHSESSTEFNSNGTVADSGNDVINSETLSETNSNFSNNGSVTDSGTDVITNEANESITRTGNGTVTKTGETKITTTEDYVMRVSGKNGGASYSKMLQEFRTTFINIDMMIINELSDLFFNLW